MMKTLIKIDTPTIRKNPNAGRSTYLIQGRGTTEITQVVKHDREYTKEDFIGWPTDTLCARRQIMFCVFCLEHLVDGQVIDSRKLEQFGAPYQHRETPEIIELMEKYNMPQESIIELMLGEKTEIVLNTTLTRDIQKVHTLSPEPNFFFEYIDTNVTCEGCGAVFSYKELKSDVDADDENYNTCICPKCGKWDCCDIEFEKLDEGFNG